MQRFVVRGCNNRARLDDINRLDNSKYEGALYCNGNQSSLVASQECKALNAGGVWKHVNWWMRGKLLGTNEQGDNK